MRDFYKKNRIVFNHFIEKFTIIFFRFFHPSFKIFIHNSIIFHQHSIAQISSQFNETIQVLTSLTTTQLQQNINIKHTKNLKAHTKPGIIFADLHENRYNMRPLCCRECPLCESHDNSEHGDDPLEKS